MLRAAMVCVSVVLALSACDHAEGAEIISEYPFLWIFGSITTSDVEQASSIMNGSRPWIVHADSPGGNLDAAMSIGRTVRKTKSMVTVDRGAQCASACLFILVGGSERSVGGKIIVHRPYLTQEVTQNSSYDAVYKQTEQRVRDYMSEMNIPASLADRMMAVPPQSGATLTAAELDHYLLNGKDPAAEQQQSVAEAKKFGISLLEQRRRQMLQDAVCKWKQVNSDATFFEFASHLTCRDAIMRGEPPEKVQDRVRLIWQRRGAVESLPQATQEKCIDAFLLPDLHSDCPLKLH